MCHQPHHSNSVLSEEGSSFIPVAVPAGAGDGDGFANPLPTAPTASYQYSEPRVAGSGPFGGGWGSALGGFALGNMMGSAFGGGGHHRHNHHGRRDRGGFGGGGGGGFNIRGDTGGGGGRQHRGGFGGGGGGGHNIRGDS